MSKYHKDCVKSKDQLPKGKRVGPLVSKPFCDCRQCSCKKCPNILQMLSITVTDNTCEFGSKGKCKGTPEAECEQVDVRNSLLDIMNEDRDCGCEVVARAVRSNVHINLGLPQFHVSNTQPESTAENSKNNGK